MPELASKSRYLMHLLLALGGMHMIKQKEHLISSGATSFAFQYVGDRTEGASCHSYPGLHAGVGGVLLPSPTRCFEEASQIKSGHRERQ
jgi:hypothetical protein